MIASLLIANRGEIACRIIATARRMGIRTVAIASDPDMGARHTRLADEVVPIGGDTAASSYLDAKKVIEAAKSAGAEAIHPGYGFLSENPGFVEAVEAAGLVFVGPGAEAIRSMGLKDRAKRLMMEAGVPVVPGYDGAAQDGKTLKAEAAKIGYPVMVKARAGGGGKGMRRVDNAKDFIDALKSTKREAKASFGDDHVLIEKSIAAPRHIEVQVFADSHGGAVHLFERDCTLQRRHQKVIEEAPAPGMNAKTRRAMTEAAIAAARAIGYRGAGTVEFIVDGSKGLRPDGFWFMEMNTRLQVEHPVTEQITGFDLVEWQLRVASGEPLPVRQEEITLQGHAVEARIYAEDVDAGFLPAPGPVTKAVFPDRARVDHGIDDPGRISPYYDPMIAKVIASGADRKSALSALSKALGGTHLLGTATNTRFLDVLTRHADVRKMAIDTTWIDRNLTGLQAAMRPDDKDVALVALAQIAADGGFDGTDSGAHGWRSWGHGTAAARFTLGGKTIERRVVFGKDGAVSVAGGDMVLEAIIAHASRHHLTLDHDGGQKHIDIVDHQGQISVALGTGTFRVDRVDPLAAAGEAAGGNTVIAPMTGVITVLETRKGKQVKTGDIVIRMEAMKMEHAMPAPCDGTVEAVNCKVGDTVEDGRVLIELRQADG